MSFKSLIKAIFWIAPTLCAVLLSLTIGDYIKYQEIKKFQKLIHGTCFSPEKTRADTLGMLITYDKTTSKVIAVKGCPK